MHIEVIKIKRKNIWLVIDQLRMYSKDNNTIDTCDEFMCYYKLTEPTPLIYGELIRDDKRKPILFDTIQSTIDYAKKYLIKRLK